MLSVADALAERLKAVENPGAGGPAMADVQLDAAQFGEWLDARTFGATAGEDGAGQKLAHVHSEFVRAYKDVIAAIRASAANHAEADARNEGA